MIRPEKKNGTRKDVRLRKKKRNCTLDQGITYGSNCNNVISKYARMIESGYIILKTLRCSIPLFLYKPFLNTRQVPLNPLPRSASPTTRNAQ
jgi:hypothetical protein